jgi:hypothetical protein
MFIPSELLDEICLYLPNRDLVGMSLVCRDWNPTCMNRISTNLSISTGESFRPRLQQFLDNFNGHGQHPDAPTFPTHVKSLVMIIKLDNASILDFSTLYAVLDYLHHIRRLELYARVPQDQLDMLVTVCRDICAHLPNVRNMVLHVSLLGDIEISTATKLYQNVYKRIMDNCRLMNLKLRHDYLFDGTDFLDVQASTLVDLHVLFCIVADPISGFHVPLFPRVKRLTLRAVGDPNEAHTGDGRILNFGHVFPSLEYLCMSTMSLCEYGGEELGNILQIVNTSPTLKHLELNTSKDLKVLFRTLPISFSHLETLVLRSPCFEEVHLRLLASLEWPMLTFLSYQSDGVYPRVVPHLLNHAPRLKWLKIYVYPDPEFLTGLEEAFGQGEWPHLQAVCILHWNEHEGGIPPVMQKACPNATIHLKFTKGHKYDSTLAYGIHLSPQCGWACYKCTFG